MTNEVYKLSHKLHWNS